MAQKTATMIPATSTPDTSHRSLSVPEVQDYSPSDPIAPEIPGRTRIRGGRDPP
ncbi:hypothetical protein GCM10010343_57330 [Streptomyces avidinii]|nr:hypothetical protein GCM10010343_57330 [Streptomyces avidinii]